MKMSNKYVCTHVAIGPVWMRFSCIKDCLDVVCVNEYGGMVHPFRFHQIISTHLYLFMHFRVLHNHLAHSQYSFDAQIRELNKPHKFAIVLWTYRPSSIGVWNGCATINTHFTATISIYGQLQRMRLCVRVWPRPWKRWGRGRTRRTLLMHASANHARLCSTYSIRAWSHSFHFIDSDCLNNE